MLKVAVILFACLVAALAANPKILGHRTETNFPNDWRKGADAAKDHELTFLVALPQNNLDVLEEKFWAVSDPDSPEYRNFLSVDEINAIVQPAEEVSLNVIQWLLQGGVTEVKRMGSDALEVRATVSAVEQLFSTQFVEFEHVKSGKKIVRQFGPFSVPENVADHVEMVSGLSEFPIPRLTLKKQSQVKRDTEQFQPAICPQSIESYYFTGTAKVSGANTSVCVVEFVDQYYAPTDLQYFSTEFAIPIKPVTKDHTVGTNYPGNPQLEATLDIEYALAIAQNAVGWFWIEADGVWLYGYAVHVNQQAVIPYVFSISYGWNEEMQCESGIGSQECQQLGVNSQQYVARVNTEFQKIGLRGASLICASGDSGANGRTDPYCSENHLNPVFPAASPYITSCGATQIDQSRAGTRVHNPPRGCSGYNCAGSGGYEEAVSYNQANFASGGGFSLVAATPAYQQQAVDTYFKSGVTLPPASYYNRNGRGFPDIAAFGSNVLIGSGRTIEGVGGTSCSSPIFAGIVTLLNDFVIAKTQKPLGFLNPLLYKMAAQAPTTFHDIVTGDNICTEDGCSAGCKGFRCTKGWDPVTGLGSPNYNAMKTYLASMLNIDEE